MSLRLNTKSMPASDAKRKKMVSQMSVAATPPPELMYDVITLPGKYVTRMSDSAKVPMNATNMVATIAAVGECHLSLTCESRSGSTLSNDMAKTILEEVMMNGGMAFATHNTAKMGIKARNHVHPIPDAAKPAMLGIQALPTPSGRVPPP